MHQVAQGMNHLHHAGIVHGDLKLKNILIGGDGEFFAEPFFMVTVCAFESSSLSHITLLRLSFRRSDHHRLWLLLQ
jgi:serine/threonine protein kinase